MAMLPQLRMLVLLYIYGMKQFLVLICFSLACCTANKPNNQLLKDVEYLSSYALQGRKTGTPENRIAARFIAERFKQLGLQSYTSDYLQPFSLGRRDSAVSAANVIAYLPGRRTEAIVISAHFDHLGVVGDKIFNGADDNASGTAALLHLAAYFAKRKPNYTLVFAAFDAEEMMLRGSAAFVEKPPLPLENIRLNINMDMVSHNDKGELYVAGTSHYPALKTFLPKTYRSARLLKGHDDPKAGRDDWTTQSDHFSFHRKNIPFLYFGVEDHKDYHRESDEFRNINQKFFIDAVELIKRTVVNIDKNM